MKFLLPFLIVVTFACPAFSSGKTDSLLAVLRTELTKEKIYDAQKEARIAGLKQQLAAIPQNDYNAQYSLCSKLYEEYKVFQFDSAYVYTQKLISISKQTKNAAHLNESRVNVAFLLLSSGMFTETFECLNAVNTKELGNDYKLQYYSIKSRAFSDLAQYNSDKTYAPFDRAQAVKYIDSAIALAPPGSFNRLYHQGNRQVVTGDLQVPSADYITLLEKYDMTEHQRAMVATGLSFFYSAPNQADQRIQLMATGAINDIRASTKETLASFELGQQFYHEGDVKDAYIFIQNAMDNAQFYGARLRKIQIGAVLPIIANQQILVSENEKNKFLIYALSIGVVAIIVSLVSFIVFIQLKRLKEKEQIIEEKNVLLEKINNKLKRRHAYQRGVYWLLFQRNITRLYIKTRKAEAEHRAKGCH